MREDIFKTIKKGDAVTFTACGGVGAAVAARDAFWNADADEPCWEVEFTGGGFVDCTSTLCIGNLTEIGGKVIYGSFPQYTTEPEPVEWRVLAVENGRALLITEKCIRTMPMNYDAVDFEWERCDLRKWLNDEFYHEAFSLEEKKRIAAVLNENPYNYTFGCDDTVDSVFVLTVEDAEKYFSNNQDRMAVVIDPSKKCGDEQYSEWWLRTIGYYCYYAGYVTEYGRIEAEGQDIVNSCCAVRPAIWVELFDSEQNEQEDEAEERERVLLSINEDGEATATRYSLEEVLVQSYYPGYDGCKVTGRVMSPLELIRRVDMQDCTDEMLEAYDISEFGKVKPLVIKGTWHDPKDSLKIVIETEDGKVVAEGRGTDH